MIEGTRWVYDPANDESLLALTKELTQAEGKYGRQALDYMRAKKVFSPDLSIPDAAFAKSIELMQKSRPRRRSAGGQCAQRARRQLSACRAERGLNGTKPTQWAMLPPDFMVDARTAVRIVCGLFFLPHTIAKLRNIERASGFFDKVGLTSAASFSSC